MRSSRVVRASDCQCQSRNSPVAEFVDTDWGDKVKSGIGLSYRPAARLHGLAGRYDTLMPLTLWIYEFGYWVRAQHPSMQWNLRGRQMKQC
jgi:hypothetical protein